MPPNVAGGRYNIVPQKQHPTAGTCCSPHPAPRKRWPRVMPFRGPSGVRFAGRGYPVAFCRTWCAQEPRNPTRNGKIKTPRFFSRESFAAAARESYSIICLDGNSGHVDSGNRGQRRRNSRIPKGTWKTRSRTCRAGRERGRDKSGSAQRSKQIFMWDSPDELSPKIRT